MAEKPIKELAKEIRKAGEAYLLNEEEVMAKGGTFDDWVRLANSWRGLVLEPSNVIRLLDYIAELEDIVVRFASKDPFSTGEWEALDKVVAEIPKED